MATNQTTEPTPAAKRAKDPPEQKFGPFPNGVGVSIWKNQVETEQGTRTFRAITVSPRRYFDRESNTWKDAASFNPTDLPSLIYALKLAAKYCFESDPPEPDGAGGGPENEELPF